MRSHHSASAAVVVALVLAALVAAGAVVAERHPALAQVSTTTAAASTTAPSSTAPSSSAPTTSPPTTAPASSGGAATTGPAAGNGAGTGPGATAPGAAAPGAPGAGRPGPATGAGSGSRGIAKELLSGDPGRAARQAVDSAVRQLGSLSPLELAAFALLLLFVLALTGVALTSLWWALHAWRTPASLTATGFTTSGSERGTPSR